MPKFLLFEAKIWLEHTKFEHYTTLKPHTFIERRHSIGTDTVTNSFGRSYFYKFMVSFFCTFFTYQYILGTTVFSTWNIFLYICFFLNDWIECLLFHTFNTFPPHYIITHFPFMYFCNYLPNILHISTINLCTIYV